MKFKPGDRVIDLATGKRGTVRVAEPRAGAKGELYALLLDDGRNVMRAGDEVAADEPPATV